MTSERRQGLRSCQLSFIGKVLSTFSHELSNHLAVIKESAGLMGDLIDMGKSSGHQDARQSLNTLHSIDHQVGRTSELCRYLGRFAHRMDRPVSTFSINEILEELIMLISRSARQRSITLEKDFQKDIPATYNDPLRLQFVIFSLAEERMHCLERKGSITFKTICSDNAITIEIIPQGAAVLEGKGKGICSAELLEETISEIGGMLSREESDGRARIVVPVTPPPARL